MKSTGHEKVRVSVCLAAKLDSTNCKPFIVFASAKRESKSLNEEYRKKCYVTGSPNGWMNEELTLRWCNEALGQFSFQCRLLVWDSFEAHMTNTVKTKLAKAKIDDGCTKYIQAPDLIWNKPFKVRIQEFYDKWLANAKHEFTAAGNMKPVPCRKIVQWVVKAWEEFSSDMITSSMKSCGLGLPVDGSEDHLISCFKEGKKSGSKLLSNQTRIIHDSSSEENPFLIIEDDIMDATPLENLIDEDV